MVEDI